MVYWVIMNRVLCGENRLLNKLTECSIMEIAIQLLFITVLGNIKFRILSISLVFHCFEFHFNLFQFYSSLLGPRIRTTRRITKKEWRNKCLSSLSSFYLIHALSAPKVLNKVSLRDYSMYIFIAAYICVATDGQDIID